MKPYGYILAAYLGEIVMLFLLTYRRFAIDKAAAADNRERVPERLLLFCIASGGALGALLAMHDLRHKTNPKTKWHFTVTVAVSLLTQTVILGVLLFFAIRGGSV